jgi:hypothetical protein
MNSFLKKIFKGLQSTSSGLNSSSLGGDPYSNSSELFIYFLDNNIKEFLFLFFLY